ncbi:hypothetical protein METBIDRAFT_41923 [Metschnikowia bicuspidata var. bicuspidata NRRL YB-4993]|uniref:Aminopeptidase P N-terminal domain-containing protein n=1 Tax=Metschnikowia bicuspidata var. bicuspidata NRRL YB-4993 TaxID=869754 RepID=A0A1A0HB39_9ASCO|nr:hypothetical protein METBIDRAFT_41923 [Metschnikowia bicuspidata var. bicuspidata NRRL YB-4993]OBA21205.1 hypothetical protein METBIDRAFT_41923 [Metschnikowia bicuspidata var. bicuspidata NRRL YB-4993]
MPFELGSISSQKYPSREHARKVYSHFKSIKINNPVGFFLSGENLDYYDYCDQTKPFRQNRYFYYLSGCEIPGSHVLYLADADELTLFLPDVNAEDIMWSGPPLLREEALEKYDVDNVQYSQNLKKELASLKQKEVAVFTMTFNKWSSPFAEFLTEDKNTLKFALDESRLIKDSFELSLMRRAASITDKCHLAVMSATPIETNETHIHAEFMYHALRQGSKYQLYDPICCAGPNCSTLHYVKNDDEINSEKRSILIDAGAEWSCYASDVTRCFPINGDWTKEHLEIYNVVLKMQQVTMSMIKPGALWDDIHLEAHRVLIREFIRLGIFTNADEKTIFDSDISARFFPHGLGHLLGMDTHDVGGNPRYDDSNQKLKYLRLRRELQKNMVLTDEPGVYFSPFLLDDILSDPTKLKFIDTKILDKYWYVGGVRIEDDLIITEDGFENMTKITSDPTEISEIIKSSSEKGAQRFHNLV